LYEKKLGQPFGAFRECWLFFFLLYEYTWSGKKLIVIKSAALALP
jgi:hypothetical protein